MLVPPAEPGGVASAIERMLAMPAAERRRWGAAGRSLVERDYDIVRVLDRWEATYEELWHRTGASQARRAPTA